MRLGPFPALGLNLARNLAQLLGGERIEQGGKPISQIDAQIAAIVRSRGARLATRNVRDFADCGITVVDPWGEP